LAAIAVLMIVIPVLLQGFVIAGAIASKARQTADAMSLAQSSLDERIATQDWVDSTPSGDEQIGPYLYHWEPKLDAWDADSPQTVQQLTMTVSWSDRTLPREISLTTVVYQPGSAQQSTTSTPALGLGAMP